MFLRIILIYSFIIVTCSTESWGQKYNIINYSTRNGLAGQIVNGVFQDNSGYIWLATQTGVSYFNGTNFTNFNPSNVISAVDAVSINQDRDGNIWIGTNANGLFIYDFKKTKNYTEKNGFISDIVRSVYKDQMKTMWVLTSKGVVRFKNNQFEKVRDPKGFFDSGVLSMIQAEDGSFWFGTQGKGLVKWSNNSFTYLNSDDGLLDNYIFSLNTIGDSLLIGTTNQGLQIYTDNKFSKIDIPEIENSWISNVIVEPTGLKIITSSGLVNYSSNGLYSLITEKNGLSNHNLYGGLIDNEKNTWLVSGYGASVILKKEIISVDKSFGLSDDKITVLSASSKNEIYAGTYGYGVNILSNNGKVIKKISHPEIMDVKIISILEIPDKKELWIGFEQSNLGIVILDINDVNYKVKKRIPNLLGRDLATVTKIASQGNTTWVATYNSGIFNISNEKIKNYKKGLGIPSNEVTTIFIDSQENLWVSLDNYGIFKFENNRFENFNKKLKIKSLNISCITQDIKGSMYFGTIGDGFYIVSKDQTHHFTTKDGLISNHIRSLLHDGKSIWMGSDKGLNKLTFDTKFTLTNIESYNEKSGLLNSEIQQNSLLLAGDNVWVGSFSGLSRLKKENEKRKEFKPPLEIFSVKLFFEDVEWEKKKMDVNKWGVPTALNLGYKENHLTITFGALSASQVQYSYLLEGQDQSWTPYSDKNEATFSNLSPGDYTFKLRAKNNLGINSEEINFPITIGKPYWQTWLFRIVVGSFLTLIVILLIRNRERRFRTQNILLENKVTERTKEAVNATERAEQQRVLVEEKNSEILSSITYAQRIQKAMLPALEDIRANLGEVEVFYKPKDIVAGDFYWHEDTKNHCMIAVADCTGHGVPGALVSVVCYNALNRSVREFGLTDPGEILDKTREIILNELSKHDENVKDGMDISLVVFDKITTEIRWAGANNPLWKFGENSETIEEIKADKQPVGMHINNNNYKTNRIHYTKNDTFVLFTDGYSDQFGGSNGKKFKAANFKKLLLEYSSSSLQLMNTTIALTFEAWRKEEEQVDDVCVLIFRV